MCGASAAWCGVAAVRGACWWRGEAFVGRGWWWRLSVVFSAECLRWKGHTHGSAGGRLIQKHGLVGGAGGRHPFLFFLWKGLQVSFQSSATPKSVRCPNCNALPPHRL